MTSQRTIFLLGLLWLGCGQDARDRDADQAVTEAPTPQPAAPPTVQQPATGAANAASIELGRLLFFDPVLMGLFGGDDASASEILADDTGIELLIARLEEIDEEITWDA